MKNNKQLQIKLIPTLALLFYTVFGISQTTIKNDTPGNYSIIIPAGVTQVTIDAYGGGGGGGSSANVSSNGGSGGGGGAYAKGIHTVLPGSTYWYTVGNGGSGGPANSTTAPSAGTNSWFNATELTNTAPTNYSLGTLAASGRAGINNTTSTPTNFGLASSSFGNNTTTNGNSGVAGSGSGGGSGGAGASPAAGGGGLGSSSSNGGNGTNPGGGGGGGNDAAANKGGSGASGQIAISWTCPTYALTSATSGTDSLCGPSTSVVTLRSNTLASGTYTVTYNLSGNTTANGSTATMVFSSTTDTGTFTTSTLNTGTTNITITNLSSYSACSTAISTNNTANVIVSSVMTAEAGSNFTTCSSSSPVSIVTGSSTNNSTSTNWTTSGTGTFSSANSITSCTYTPSPADITAGSITLTLIASKASCPNVTSTKTLSISSPMIALAGINILTCSTAGAVNITNGSGATNQTSVLWTHNGGGTLANNTSLTACTYTPTVAENTAGSTITLTLTSTNAVCSNATSTKTFSISKVMTANAGTNIIHCSTVGSVEITTGSSATNQTGILWTSSGSGIFSNNTSLTSCLYTPSATDITNGSVTLTLTASNTGCANVIVTKTLLIRQPITVDAGSTVTSCTSSGAVNITAGSSATNQTGIIWSSSGTGAFINANSLTSCTYSPSAADNSAGNVTLTLTASNSACNNVISTKTLNIIVPPTAIAGSTITTCATSGEINITSGSNAINQTSILWTSSGTGSFTNANSLITCSYNPSIADISLGNVILTLIATNAGCSTISTKVLTIYSLPITEAGSAINTCSTSGAVNVTTGASATNHTDVNWSTSGTGTFANANSLTNCTYTPSGADITAGTVTLTLSVTNPGCSLVATSTKIVTISYPMTAVAGTSITTCSTSSAVNITTGSSATNQTSIAWTHNGSGTITNPNSLTTCTYTPSAAENTAGSTITLTLTASNAGCANVTSTKNITISRTMTAVAGTAINTCSTSGAVNITAGSSATNQTGITWTSSGTGTFTNNTSLTTCTYTPSATDITTGSVILTLTASNVACPTITSTKTLTISKLMTAVAGTVINTCATTGAVNITTGSSATNQTTATWTSNGTGTFTNATSLTTCTYTPSAAENTAGSTITLTLTGTNAGCTNVTATKSLIISKAMTAVAGATINTCSTSGVVNITAGSSATNQTQVTWTSNGSGTFTNANSLTTCTYYPSTTDIVAGTIILTLTASNAGCANVISTKSLIISKPMITEAGTDILTCSLVGAVNITAGSSASNQTGQTWTSSGTGTFANATSLTTCTYTPSLADITAGFVTLTLTTTNAACASEFSNKSLVIYTSPVITATTPATRTGVGTVILGATTTAGTLYWYSSLTGGTLLGFGTSFQTPSISATTTYFVEAVNGGICTSTPRIAVTATVLYSEIDLKGNGVSIIDGDVTPSTTDWTDFGSTNLARTFTISNTGLGVLNISSISLTGTNASDFSITSAPNDDVASNSSTTFTITFSPTTAGIKTATVIINNNDIDENQFDFKIQGTGVAQEINILGNSVSIADGDITPTTADWTDYGSTVDTRIFTLQNLGNIPISIGAITFSGTNPTDFTIISAPSSTISAYGSTTMEVMFTPGAINSRTATISIINNDSNENPYDFALSGFGIIPEINLKGNTISIVSGDTTPSTTDWTDFSNNNITRTFTIFNEGNRVLTLGAISISGSDFTVTTPPSSSIGAFKSSTFVVTFNPTSTGLKSATISIVNNDTTGGENPYTFKIQGTGVAQEIDIQGNATSIVDGDTTSSTTDGTDFSDADLYRTFTIFNSGNIILSIGAITFVGGNPTDFTISTAPSSTVAAFSSTTFVVRFNTAAISGTRSTTINIANNDSSENPYDFKIQGTAGAPEINITSQYGVTIADNDITPSQSDQTDFGELSIDGGQITVNFIVENTGTAAMSIGAGSFSGTNATDFTLITPPNSVIAAGENSRFQIRFATEVKGIRTATFSLINNDSNENPYNFNLSCIGVQTYNDSDGDGVTDNIDLDDDNDGINDVKEQTDGSLYPLTSIVKHDFLNETFGAGTTKGEININTSGATCTYCYEDGYGTTCEVPAMVKTLEDGEYCVTYKITGALASDPENIHGDLAWYNGLDHTPGDTNGRMAVFNASFPVGTFYETRIDGLIPNTPIDYSFWVLNIMNQTLFPGSILPNITVEFLDVNYNLVTSFNTGFITRCSTSNPSDNTCATANWLQFATTASLGDLTSCIIRFKNNSTGGGGNDLAIDDINISQKYIDTDGDGIANIFDLDDDNDGISDIEEAGFKSKSNGLSKMDVTTPSTWIDTNRNGQNDNIDTLITAGTYALPDTDGDGVPDYLDLDSDNDSLYDVDEAGIYNGDGDINGDGKGDLLDADGDGILDLYDNNNSVFGTSVRAFAQDTDADGIPDYLELDSNNDGIKDIKDGLYSSLDTNNDGKVDGSSDSDKDGLLDTFDTNDQVIGSPRDLNRKLQLEFDGRNDYGEGTGLLGGLSSATLMAWIDLNTAFSSDGVIIGQTNFQLRVTSLKRLEAVVNGTVSTYTIPLNASQWTHVGAVYGGGLLKLFINGLMVKSISLTGNLNADTSKLTIGKNPGTNTNYFKGKIDELRVFNTALTDNQFQRMVYQEIQNTSSQVRGAIIPVDIGSLTYSKLARYYRMDSYNDDILDDTTTLSLDNGAGMKIYNNKNIYTQQAPIPFVTERTGNFATAINNTTNDVRGQDATDSDYSIILVKHNITETSNSIDIGMIVDPGVNIVMNNDAKIQNDWYLKLDGKIDLVDKSQLVQTANSVLDITSSGSIERDQQGQSNLYNYNYWCSPTSPINVVANNRDYTIDDVLRDGTNVANTGKINWVSSLNGAATSPISISNRWLYKFDNYSNSYANWVKITQTSVLRVGQGFTMKGSGAISGTQNLTFVGKPNNGTITTNSVSSNQLLLTGNPYPSALNATQFINDNINSIDGTIYFWEHYSSNNSHVLSKYQGGYATRNLTGGVMATSSNVNFISKLGTPSRGIPNQFIPVGQGFFVNGKVGSGGTVTFNNGQRSFQKEDASGISNSLYKISGSTKKTTNELKNNTNDPFVEEQYKKIRLGFTSNDQYHKQLLLGFIDGKATKELDYGYDAINFDDIPNDVYFLIGENQLVIQGDGTFDPTESYPIGVKTDVEGKVSFMIDDLENFEENQEVYIYDKEKNSYHDIRNVKFEINMPKGINHTRFSLRFKNNNASLAVEENIINEEIVIKYVQSGNLLQINNNKFDTTVEKVTVYNLLGQSMATMRVENQDQKNIQISFKNSSSGVYIAKIKTSNGNISKKFIVN